MRPFRTTAALGVSLAVLAAAPPPHAAADTAPPGSEVLSYTIEWRFIHAGNARLTWSPSGDGFTARLHLESAGMVSSIYKVDDDGTAMFDRELCAVSLNFQATEGSRRHDTTVTFDAAHRKASYRDRDLVKNVTVTHETGIQPCTQDVIGALYALRRLRLEPGRSAEIPVSDGKKAVMAKVEAQERETLKLGSTTYKTIRYEAFLFNNVLFRRSGRLFVWITDDDRRLPVQVRFHMPFYIGTVTLQLARVSKP